VKAVSVLMTLGICALSRAAYADIVKFRVDGTLTSINDPNGFRPIASQVGDAYSLVYSFESTAIGHREGTTPVEILRYDAITAVSLFIGGTVFEMSPTAWGEIELVNDYCLPFGGCDDGYHVTASNSIIESLYFRMQLALGQNTPTPGTALTSLLLPLTPPDLSAFRPGGVSFQFANPYTGATAYLGGSITSISAVPVPAAVWLLGSVLLGGTAIRRRTVSAIV
jgi:hypothetical protein